MPTLAVDNSRRARATVAPAVCAAGVLLLEQLTGGRDRRRYTSCMPHGKRRIRTPPASVIAGLSRIPGVGPSIAADLYSLGIREVAELRGRNAESLYAELCREVGTHVDRCALYVFRCAVYFASEPEPDPELLKWWNWKDAR
jgi:hypothetical protein